MSYLISFKQIPGVYFLCHVLQAVVVAVGNNGLTARFKRLQIIDYFTAKKRTTVFQRGFVDDNRGPFGFDTFHNALDRTLPEVITIFLIALF